MNGRKRLAAMKTATIVELDPKSLT